MTEQEKPRRLVFCFDGTWNRLSADCPTNVVRLAQMVCPIARDGVQQIVHYDEGIGTDSRLNRWSGGILGEGMLKILREAYRFLIFNYRLGDQIYAFGFSRGAYTARSFIGFIRHAGILDVARASAIDQALRLYSAAPAGKVGKELDPATRFRLVHCTAACVSEEDRDERVRLFPTLSAEDRAGFHPDYDPAALALIDFRYLGVCDTVRALGIPDFLPFAARANRKYAFHDAVLTSKVQAARHAVAIDEPRLAFRPTLFGRDKVAELNALAARGRAQPFADWELPYMERWFPGVHGAVGGGGDRRGLSDIALAWVLRGARRAGLDVRTEDGGAVYGLMHDPLDALQNSTVRRWTDRPPVSWLRALLHRARRDGPTGLPELGLSTLARWHAIATYRPRTLAGAAQAIAAWSFAPGFEAKRSAAGWRKYRVVIGDTLIKIAIRLLGDADLWLGLFAANRDQLDDPDDITVGMELRVPPREWFLPEDRRPPTLD
jgi:uncharacterized protein (DUF2235 family)